jgi:molecular chaperone Hsp33
MRTEAWQRQEGSSSSRFLRETRIGELPSLTDLLRRQTPEEFLDMLFEGIPYQVLEKRNVAFVCSCSLEKIERVLMSLGREDLKTVLEEQGGAEVTCEFCRKPYVVSKQELEALIAEMRA